MTALAESAKQKPASEVTQDLQFAEINKQECLHAEYVLSLSGTALNPGCRTTVQ